MTVGIISAEEGHGWLPIGRLQKVLLRELSDRGWLTSSGQLRTKLMAPAFVEYAKSFSGLLEMAALPSATGDAETQLGRLLRPMRTGTHPLRYITLIDWLFPDAAAFRSVVAETDLEEPVSREVVLMVLIGCGGSRLMLVTNSFAASETASLRRPQLERFAST